MVILLIIEFLVGAVLLFLGTVFWSWLYDGKLIDIRMIIISESLLVVYIIFRIREVII